MSTAKILITIPEELKSRADAIIPARQRSATICRLIENEIMRREKKLYECALAVEKDEQLNKEMQDWDTTLQDGGISDESW